MGNDIASTNTEADKGGYAIYAFALAHLASKFHDLPTKNEESIVLHILTDPTT